MSKKFIQSERIKKAVDFATKAHEGQKRKSGEPYIIHPKAVMETLLEWGMDEDTVIAGILHDTVEDTAVTLEDVEREFGETVAFLVDGVTKIGKARSGMRDIDTYLPQTRDNLLRLLVATGSDIRVLIIKLADRLHNMRTLAALPPEKQKKIAKETLEVFAPLADRLNMGQLRVELADLAFSYVDPKRYDYLKKLLTEKNKSAEKALNKVQKGIEDLMESEKIKFEIDGRVKSIYSLHKKLAKYNQNIDQIYDLTALRIIVNDITDCYLVLGLIHSLYTPMAGRIKDYIAMPKFNGYQSLHTTVLTPDKQITEFQIRTHEMHEYAERGLAASFYYNEQKLTESYRTGKIQHLPTNLLWISELQDTAIKLKQGKKINLDKLKLILEKSEINAFISSVDNVAEQSLEMAQQFSQQVMAYVISSVVVFISIIFMSVLKGKIWTIQNKKKIFTLHTSGISFNKIIQIPLKREVLISILTVACGTTVAYFVHHTSFSVLMSVAIIVIITQILSGMIIYRYHSKKEFIETVQRR